MASSLPPPLGGAAPNHRPLANSPLVRVLVQARFSSILKIDSKDGVAPFQDLVRRQYPLLEQVTSHGFQVELTANVPNFRPTATNVWRFSDASKSFVASLTSDTITLEASNYPGREAFLAKWAQLLRWVEDSFAPGLAVRIGIRYLNRIDRHAMDRLPDWIASNLIGVALPEYREYVTQAISEANLKTEEGEMLLRWGILPKNATIDPGLIAPVETASWLLDIDAFSSEQRLFQTDELAAAYKALSERAYAVFRWALTSKGLTHFEQA